jgi:putative pantetheine hydrolase
VPRIGQGNTLTDVGGLRVGHATLRTDGALTGTTVVLAPPEGAVAGVDVRGGGPGTRETDLLDPRNLVERVHAVVLTGGSAFGLAAADGVMSHLFQAGVGFPMGEPGEVVPIVPAAVIFDLGRGGDFAIHPDASTGAAAAAAASSDVVPLGSVGAGTGALAGGLKGGVGSASQLLEDGSTVAALVVANPAGSTVDLATGELYAARFGVEAELTGLRRPASQELRTALDRAAEESASGRSRPLLATTIGVIATDATLTKAQCQKVAGVGHDGLARAIRPVHSMVDGDTLFALSTTARPAPDPEQLHELLTAAADCVTRAVGRAVIAAESVRTAAGEWRSYREAFPSAFT